MSLLAASGGVLNPTANRAGLLFVKLARKEKRDNTGDLAFTGIKGVDYSTNRRGLSIVVFDKTSQTVIDTADFDTHSSGFPRNIYVNRKTA
ncbi:MAG: hypothetical protein LBH85_07440 [Treponema sp.]|jgi:hypothetical protein|nr:hypothetical protein [Treponema sp.]